MSLPSCLCTTIIKWSMVQGIVQSKVQRFQRYTEKQNPNINQLEELLDIYDLTMFTSVCFLVVCRDGFLYWLLKFEVSGVAVFGVCF